MAGPTFSFWYERFPEASCAQLEALATKLARPYHRRAVEGRGTEHKRTVFDAELYIETPTIARTGTIGLHVDRLSDDHYPVFVGAAFERQLGFVPRFELGGYCMCKQPNDWDALRLLAERVAATFGGWVIERAVGTTVPVLPHGMSLLSSGVCEVVARDEAGYFGAMVNDLEYVRQYRDSVPAERYWVIDARLAPSGWVRK